jgi:hypothetical protein
MATYPSMPKKYDERFCLYHQMTLGDTSKSPLCSNTTLCSNTIFKEEEVSLSSSIVRILFFRFLLAVIASVSILSLAGSITIQSDTRKKAVKGWWILS